MKMYDVKNGITVNLDNGKKIAGELAARDLSPAAFTYYTGADLTIYEYRIDDPDDPDGADLKRYALQWDTEPPIMGLTFKELDARLIWEMSDFVIDRRGRWVTYSWAVEMMDDDIREALAADLAPCTEQEFFTAYEKAHREKYGTDFETP